MKKFFLSFLLVLSLFSANTTAFAHRESGGLKKESTVRETHFPLNEQIAVIRGLMNSYVKVNENDRPVFQNFPQHKRFQAQNFSWTLAAAQNACFAFYSRAWDNSVHTSPFYIAYRRLTV
jgi:hypothetical protein